MLLGKNTSFPFVTQFPGSRCEDASLRESASGHRLRLPVAQIQRNCNTACAGWAVGSSILTHRTPDCQPAPAHSTFPVRMVALSHRLAEGSRNQRAGGLIHAIHPLLILSNFLERRPFKESTLRPFESVFFRIVNLAACLFRRR